MDEYRVIQLDEFCVLQLDDYLMTSEITNFQNDLTDVERDKVLSNKLIKINLNGVIEQVEVIYVTNKLVQIDILIKMMMELNNNLVLLEEFNILPIDASPKELVRLNKIDLEVEKLRNTLDKFESLPTRVKLDKLHDLNMLHFQILNSMNSVTELPSVKRGRALRSLNLSKIIDAYDSKLIKLKNEITEIAIYLKRYQSINDIFYYFDIDVFIENQQFYIVNFVNDTYKIKIPKNLVDESISALDLKSVIQHVFEQIIHVDQLSNKSIILNGNARNKDAKLIVKFMINMHNRFIELENDQNLFDLIITKRNVYVKSKILEVLLTESFFQTSRHLNKKNLGRKRVKLNLDLIKID